MNYETCPLCGTPNAIGSAVCPTCGKDSQIISKVTVVKKTTAYTLPTPAPVSQPQCSTAVNYPKASIKKRILASLIDGMLGGGLLVPVFFLTLIIHGILAFLSVLLIGGWSLRYNFFKDGMPGGQSYGKKRNGLMVVNLTNNQPCTNEKSFLRALSFCFLFISALIEGILVITTNKGRRLGDIFAGTQVIEVSQYKPLADQSPACS